MLAYRDRSVKEIHDGLQKKEFHRDIIEQVIEKLEEFGYLDDSKFALNYGESLARNKKVGPRYVSTSLFKKGIDRELAQNTVKKIFPEQDSEIDEIAIWVERKLAGYKKSLTPIQKKKRVFDFLLRKGFTHGAIMRVISNRDFR